MSFPEPLEFLDAIIHAVNSTHDSNSTTDKSILDLEEVTWEDLPECGFFESKKHEFFKWVTVQDNETLSRSCMSYLPSKILTFSLTSIPSHTPQACFLREWHC